MVAEIKPLSFTPSQASEIAIKAKNCLQRLAPLVAPITEMAKRHAFVIEEVAQAEKDAREASGNDFELTQEWTRQATSFAEQALESRCLKLRDEIARAYELVFDLRAAIEHLAAPEQSWSEILPSAKTVLMMITEWIEARGDRHFPSAKAEALNFMASHPACIFRIPNTSELARMAAEIDIQTSARRDPSPENRRRLADRHDCGTKDVSRIAGKKRAA